MKVSEVRTQLYLTQEQHDALKRLAGERSVSMAKVVREAVSAYVLDAQAGDGGLTEEEYRRDPAFTLVDFIKTLPKSKTKDLALRHDDYLYGRKSQ